MDYSISPGLLRSLLLGFLWGLVSTSVLGEDQVCAEKADFVKDGWRVQEVQDAMDNYLRDHKVRANWLDKPAAPAMIGRDYYEWLWHSDFGAGMKSYLVSQFCAAGVGNNQ